MQGSRVIQYRLMLLIAMNLFIFHTALSQNFAGAEMISCNESGCTREESVQVALTEDATNLVIEWGKGQNIEIPSYEGKDASCCVGGRWHMCHVVTFTKDRYKNFSRWLKERNKSAKGKSAH